MIVRTKTNHPHPWNHNYSDTYKQDNKSRLKNVSPFSRELRSFSAILYPHKCDNRTYMDLTLTAHAGCDVRGSHVDSDILCLPVQEYCSWRRALISQWQWFKGCRNWSYLLFHFLLILIFKIPKSRDAYNSVKDNGYTVASLVNTSYTHSLNVYMMTWHNTLRLVNAQVLHHTHHAWYLVHPVISQAHIRQIVKSLHLNLSLPWEHMVLVHTKQENTFTDIYQQ